MEMNLKGGEGWNALDEPRMSLPAFSRKTFSGRCITNDIIHQFHFLNLQSAILMYIPATCISVTVTPVRYSLHFKPSLHIYVPPTDFSLHTFSVPQAILSFSSPCINTYIYIDHQPETFIRTNARTKTYLGTFCNFPLYYSLRAGCMRRYLLPLP
jgi:hypothetical protein